MDNDKKNSFHSTERPLFFRLGFMPFIEELGDDGFRNIKVKFVGNFKKILILPKERVTYELLKVMCASDLLPEFDKARFAKILNCFCFSNVLWSSIIKRYVGNLIEIAKEKMKDKLDKDDAKKELDDLDELANLCQKCLDNMQPTEVIQYLVDIYKAVTCLGGEKEEYGYRFQVDKSALKDTEDRLLLRYDDQAQKACSFSQTGRADNHIYFEEKEQQRKMIESSFVGKRYLVLLSWLLEELICDQDGIGEELEVLSDE